MSFTEQSDMGNGTTPVVDPYTAFLELIEQLRTDGVSEDVIGGLMDQFIAIGGGADVGGVSYPPRQATDPYFAPEGWDPSQGPYLYDGPYVVDFNGEVLVERDQQGKPRQIGTTFIPININPLVVGSQEYVQLAQTNPEYAEQLIDTLSDKGFATGTIQQNVRAFQALVEMGVQNGVDWRTMFTWIQENQPDAEDGAQISIPSVTSIDDIKAIANRTALDVIGRELSDAEATRLAFGYRGMQTGYYEQTQDPEAQMAVQAPTPTTYAQQFVEQQMPQEERAYAAMNRVESLFNAARSRV